MNHQRDVRHVPQVSLRASKCLSLKAGWVVGWMGWLAGFRQAWLGQAGLSSGAGLAWLRLAGLGQACSRAELAELARAGQGLAGLAWTGGGTHAPL